MQSHSNSDFPDGFDFDGLVEKAERMNREGTNTITAGKQDEEPLASWSANRMSVTEMPPDEHGVLRLSVGGLLDGRPGPWGYLVFRGNRDQCRRILERALRALNAGDGVS